jgi:hypothetical protein
LGGTREGKKEGPGQGQEKEEQERQEREGMDKGKYREKWQEVG